RLELRRRQILVGPADHVEHGRIAGSSGLELLLAQSRFRKRIAERVIPGDPRVFSRGPYADVVEAVVVHGHAGVAHLHVLEPCAGYLTEGSVGCRGTTVAVDAAAAIL